MTKSPLCFYVLLLAIIVFTYAPAPAGAETEIQIEKTETVQHEPAAPESVEETGAEAAGAEPEAVAGRADPGSPDWRLPVGSEIERFTIKDINNRLIPAGQLKDWIIVYGFGNENTAEESIGWLKELTLEEKPGDGVLFVCVADTTKHNNKLLRPVVKKILKKEYRRNISSLQEKLDENNIDLGYPLENRFMLVADMQADVYELFGIHNQREKPHIVIVDGRHRVMGHFNEYSEKVPETFRLAVTQRETEKQLDKLTIKKRKKNMLVRYAIGGALGYLIYKAFD